LRPGEHGERGSATVELAASLPALVLLLLVGLSAVGAVRTRAECEDAAHEAARQAARGGDGVAAGTRVAPAGAVVRIELAGDLVLVTVTAPVHPLGGRVASFTVTATAAAELEPGPS
jgi:Flp pilus assembly protein TadG